MEQVSALSEEKMVCDWKENRIGKHIPRLQIE